MARLPYCAAMFVASCIEKHGHINDSYGCTDGTRIGYDCDVDCDKDVDASSSSLSRQEWTDSTNA